MVCNTPLLRKAVAFNIFSLLELLTLVSLARLSHGTERESGLLPYIDRCLTPQKFIGAWTGSDDVVDVMSKLWWYNNKFFRRCALINREVCVALHMIYLSCTCQLNNYYSSVIGRHVCKHRQNQFMPQESLGVLCTDLYMAVNQILFPPHVRVWPGRLCWLVLVNWLLPL